MLAKRYLTFNRVVLSDYAQARVCMMFNAAQKGVRAFIDKRGQAWRK
jgi:hypothetical protein